MRKLPRGNKIKYSLASYSRGKGNAPVCDVDELADILKDVGSIPERLNFTKACEIALLCRRYLQMSDILKKKGLI